MSLAIFSLVVAVLIKSSQASCLSDVGTQSNVGIIGGHEISIEKAPYMAALRFNGSLGKDGHLCGGSIIHEKFILTAAHCCMFNKDMVKVLVGTENIDGEGGELYEIEEMIRHENYSSESQDYDVAIIKLKEPLTFGPKVAKINLVDPFTTVEPDTKLNSTGWGLTESDDLPSKLQQVEIPIVNFRLCREIFGIMKRNVTMNMICAGSSGHQPYKGDSGGPLTLNDVQYGIVSFGACPGKIPAVFTDVTSVICWIVEKISSNV